MTPAQALTELGTFCRDIKPVAVPVYPTHRDAREFIREIECLIAKVNTVLTAYGEIAAENFGVDIEAFRNAIQLEDVLADIDRIGERKSEEMREFYADKSGWAKAHERGVD